MGGSVFLRNISSNVFSTKITSDAGVEARRSLPDRAGAEGLVAGLGPDFANARGASEGLGSGVEARHSWPDLAGAERSVEGSGGPSLAIARSVVKGSESGTEALHVLEPDLVFDRRDTLHNHRAVRTA